MKNFFFIATMMFATCINAENVNKTNNASNAPASIEIAKSRSHAMIQTTTNGIAYKYEYITDDEGRVVNRITSTWNDDKNVWMPLAAYSIVYTPNETILSYGKYNNATKSYSRDMQQTRYNAQEYPVLFNLPECLK